MKGIYLDYNATTPIARSVQEAMLPFLAEHYGNPSSSHSMGCAAKGAVEDARSRVASLLGAVTDEIVFTSGGTESNNLAIKGLAFREGLPHGRVVISAIEHAAVTMPARFLEKLGVAVDVVGCDRFGRVDPDDVRRAIRPETFLVSVMHANNEIGTVQPIREIGEICRDRGVTFHTDAAQSAGKIPIQVQELNADLISIAGHKLYAPKGVGALYVRRDLQLEPHLHGAGHEAGLRAGTENVPYIVGLGAAAVEARANLDSSMTRSAALRDQLEDRFREALGESFSINGPPDDPVGGWARLPNTLSANFHGVEGHQLLSSASEAWASTGAACHAGEAKLSATAAAIGLNQEIARGTIRLSVGRYNTEDEVDRAANLLIDAWERLSHEPRGAI